MEYDGRCGTCLEFKDKRNCRDCFDIKYANSEKGYCDYYRSYYWADDSCDHYKNNGRLTLVVVILRLLFVIN